MPPDATYFHETQQSRRKSAPILSGDVIAAIKVIENTGRILRSFTHERPLLTLTECAVAADLTKSSAYRLLLSLEEIGFVEREDRHWRLGPAVVELSTVRLGQLDLRHEARKALGELRRIFRAATAFSVPHLSDMVYVDRQESPQPFAATARLGAVHPMWMGASGIAVLAGLPTEERNAVLDVEGWHQLPAENRTLVTDAISMAEQRGFSVDPGTFNEGISGVAVAIRDEQDGPIAALSVILPPSRLRSEVITEIGGRLLVLSHELERSFAGISRSPAAPPVLAASAATA